MASEKKTSTQPVLTQSIFNTAYVPTRSWSSYATSTVLHGALILALLLITFPAIKEQLDQHRNRNITLIAPQIPQYKLKIPPPQHLQTPQPAPKLIARTQPPPKIAPVIKPPEPKPVQPKPVQIAAAPEIKIAPVAPPAAVPETRPMPPAPKPQVKMGAFERADAAHSQRAADAVKVGGFGDPNGVHPSDDAKASANTMARLGSFDSPPGAGTSGGGGKNASGGFKQTSFGSAGEPGGTPGGTGHGGGTVHTGGFGEGAVSPQMAQTARPKPIEPAFTPVEILSKPRPIYTQEARNLKLEGQVALEVVFLSSGSVRILRIAHGLGHGLDEAAEQAAMQVHFRPATRGGVPVDANATIHITFQLT